MDVEAYEAAGLLDCPAEAREGRLELLEHLAALGLSVDQMREAGDRGSLHAAGSDAMIRPGTHRGIEEIATSAGVSAQLIRRVLQAAGISAADDDFRESDEETFRLFGVGTIEELDEGEAPRPTGFTVDRQHHVRWWSDG